MQVPAVSIDIVVPEEVHTVGVVVENVRGSPELALATGVSVVPTYWLPCDPKVIVCATSATLNVLVTLVAAAYVALPAWLAVMEHAPPVKRVAVLPETVQIEVEFEVKVTGRPELAVAESPTLVPTVCPGIVGKLIVCGFRRT
jgi:hypothetical protein